MTELILNRQILEFQICGLTLRGQYYEPKNPKAIIVLVHGMGEYSRRYERNVIPFLLQESFTIISYDQFGHGTSEGKKGHHPGYECILDGLDKAVEIGQELHPELPVFIYGHSMGGNVVINYALKRGKSITGTIATSPFLALAFDPPAWKLKLGKIIDRIYPSLTLANELDVNALSKDENEVRLYENDPLIHNKISSRFSIKFMKTGEWAINNATLLKSQMLLLHGAKDKITSAKASRRFAENAGDSVQYVTIDNGFHELHNDKEKQIVLDTICTWINKQITLIKK